MEQNVNWSKKDADVSENTDKHWQTYQARWETVRDRRRVQPKPSLAEIEGERE